MAPTAIPRVLVPSSFTLRESNGVTQVATDREGIHLYDFHLRAARYGSFEVGAPSPDVTLATLRFREGERVSRDHLDGDRSWKLSPATSVHPPATMMMAQSLS